MSCITVICQNPLCAYIGFKSTDVCPSCGGPIHEQWDEEPEPAYEIAPRYFGRDEG